MTINRIRASKAKQSNSDPEGLKSVFGQLFKEMRNVRYSSLRGAAGQQMWNTIFSGEGSIDIGGPYRGVCEWGISVC